MSMKMWFSSTFQISIYCWKIFYSPMCMTYFNVKYVIGLFWGIRISSGVLRYVYMQIFIRSCQLFFLVTHVLSGVEDVLCLNYLHKFWFDLVYELFRPSAYNFKVLTPEIYHIWQSFSLCPKKRRKNCTNALILPLIHSLLFLRDDLWKLAFNLHISLDSTWTHWKKSFFSFLLIVLIWLFCSTEATSLDLSRLRLSDMLKMQKTGKYIHPVCLPLCEQSLMYLWP